MNYVEYGKENGDVILLLHGGGLSWWSYREVAEELASDYCVIIPILDGHGGCDADFTTIEDNAARIIDFIDRELGGSVKMIGGLSLGGQILLEILSERPDIARYALIESALVTPSRLTYAMIKPAFGSCYPLIKKRWFSRLQFKSLKINPELFEEYYTDTARITKENMISFLEANALYSIKESLKNTRAECHVFVGAKEVRSILKSAQIIYKTLHGSHLTVIPRLRHGEFSLNNAAIYAAEIRKIIN